ncbi:4-hydroxy-tetrahydrodipicolinate synthase [Desulfoplanes formicivorans]|uniref:4-hydroxy-tetrahydrodipicolinate synthase n=1 Tax=Desulfoplanes formicivorans TaxID=1592317 RepID=A0A194AKV4_9BACT|nr:4-hydroxy-tetrahydrodipicolinate synthase [Desulfoplanes formicivorans]GAU09329.1 dihydrodipicolinate synthase [Desulfoplanes formicivorans]
MEFKGALTALVTPFKNEGIDEDAYRAFIEWQIESGIDGVVPCGTTGESATLSHDEHKEVIRICIDQVKKRVPVLAGSGSNNTREAIELTRFAKSAGADGALMITPYYNKPTQNGMIAHFKAIASEVSLPMVVYNVPGRTGTNLLPSTLGRMAREIPTVIGVKEATGDMKQAARIVEECGEDFTLLSGDDFTILPFLALGGKGVISVISNIEPAKTHAMCAACQANDWKTARALFYELAPLNRAMFLESNPIPVKTSVALMGKMEPTLRLPMTPLSVEHLATLKTVLKEHQLI